MTARGLVVATIVVLTVGTGGAASARWSTTGTGSGAGATGTVMPVSLSAGTPSAGLFPGGQANVVLSVSNPNTGSIHIPSFVLSTTEGTGGFAVDAGHSGCAVSVLSFTTQTNGGAGWSVPAKVGGVNGTLNVTLTNALSMSTSAANACQGATFTVYLAVGT